MRCLVTGGTGVLGKEAVKALVADKHEVIVLARREDRAAAVRALGASVALGDVREPATLAAPIAGVECVVHFAGSVPGEKDRAGARQLDVEGTRTVADVAAAAGVKRFVLASTTTIVGDMAGASFDETSASRPAHSFAQGKLEAENLLQAMKTRGLESLVLRIAHVYGLGGGFKPFVDQIVARKMILPSREIYWGWISPDDVGRAAALVAAKGVAGERYVISDEKPTSISDVFEYLARLLEVDLPKQVPAALARLRLGAEKWAYLAESAKPRNDKLKALGFKFSFPTYREGVAGLLAAILLEQHREARPGRVPFFKVSEKAPIEGPHSKKPTASA